MDTIQKFRSLVTIKTTTMQIIGEQKTGTTTRILLQKAEQIIYFITRQDSNGNQITQPRRKEMLQTRNIRTAATRRPEIGGTGKRILVENPLGLMKVDQKQKQFWCAKFKRQTQRLRKERENRKHQQNQRMSQQEKKWRKLKLQQ